VLQKIKNIYHFFNAFLAVAFYGFPAKNLTVVGVTGTDGKTTTATMIYHLLKKSNKKVALISTVAAYIGNKEISTGFHVTSPAPWAIQKLIAQISKKGYKYLVLEATSHGLDQHRLLGTNISIGVLTNITHEHLDYHKTYHNYLKAKAKLFKKAQYAILNQDDQSYQKVTKNIPKSCQIIDYSLKDKAPKYFDQEYNQANALAAIKTVKLLGISNPKFSDFLGIKGRMEKIPNKKGLNIFIDFAHTPNALKQALKSLRTSRHQPSNIISVFGAAGLRDHAKRPLMGNIASKLADIVVLTAEDPRTEDVNQIVNQIKKGVTGKAKIYIEADRQQAINLAINKLAKKGDTVAILGKGHEQSMCFGTIEKPWSDHKAVKNALKQK